ncbi:CPBP family intramembrane glutamic endopeptidase [Poseidonibacter lekithochrous]|uniref:CPBP family intramembrane glutamic endopeptidase n=1 Tax=Poseidonibacter lekithochrous TaxID=1904463 RepID=UPI0013DA31B5|nr:CPBP family intramembrane glutamic endopeptidase [Poseidonibacter lekithochrous]
MPIIRTFKSKTFLVFEFIALFILFPLVLYIIVPTPVLPFLWLVCVWCIYILLKDEKFNRKNLLRNEAVNSNIKSVLFQFFGISLFIALLMFFFIPDMFFSLIKSNIILWFAVIVLYPLLSVYPQELVYRAFFFHRYKSLFKNKEMRILINAFLFGFMHIIFHNWIAVILTIGGGYLFAKLYMKTHSLTLLFIAHSLYGCMLFTIGLGEFFYTGTVSTIEQTFKF